MRNRFGKETIALLAVASISLAIISFATPHAASRRPEMMLQTNVERSWLAGRYDGNRIIVYFEAVKFDDTVPKTAKKIAPPVADLFFTPEALPASFVASLQSGPVAERFKVGDRYDVLLGNGVVATATITTLVGFESDEQVGNNSFIGALCTVEGETPLFFTRNYYAARRHRNSPVAPRPTGSAGASKYVHILEDPIPYQLESRLVRLLTDREKQAVPALEDSQARVSVEQFMLSDGTLRYYVRADWTSTPASETSHALGAWITPQPQLRVLATESRVSIDEFAHIPKLLNVVDFGNGRIGVIMSTEGGDSRTLTLSEYRDGANLDKMRLIQSISVGE